MGGGYKAPRRAHHAATALTDEPDQESPMISRDNIQIVGHVFEAWNKHDPDRYVRLLDEKHVIA